MRPPQFLISPPVPEVDHAASDGVIALAYFCIPALLVYFVRKRSDVPFQWVFLMFGAFIVLCGSTHAMEVWTLWHGTYRLSGVIKAGTGVLSGARAMTTSGTELTIAAGSSTAPWPRRSTRRPMHD